MTDWWNALVAGSIYALGTVGLFAVTLLPLRAFLALRRNWHLWHESTFCKAALLMVAVAAVAALSLSIPCVARVFRCLTEAHCGANRASGWFYWLSLVPTTSDSRPSRTWRYWLRVGATCCNLTIHRSRRRSCSDSIAILGGSITFDQQTRQATGHNVSDRRPIVTIV